VNLRVNWWTKLQSLGFIVFVVTVGLGVTLLFVPLLRQRHAMQEELRRLDRELTRAEATEKKQKAEIEALQTDAGFVERTARDKLNLARPNETLFRFEPVPVPPAAAIPQR
jgi:cell division protein FtsB